MQCCVQISITVPAFLTLIPCPLSPRPSPPVVGPLCWWVGPCLVLSNLTPCFEDLPVMPVVFMVKTLAFPVFRRDLVKQPMAEILPHSQICLMLPSAFCISLHPRTTTVFLHCLMHICNHGTLWGICLSWLQPVVCYWTFCGSLVLTWGSA